MNSNIVLSLKVNHERGYFAKNLSISTKLSESFRIPRLAGQKSAAPPKPHRFKKQKIVAGTERQTESFRRFKQRSDGPASFWKACSIFDIVDPFGFLVSLIYVSKLSVPIH